MEFSGKEILFLSKDCDDFAVRFLSSKKDSNRIANTTTSFENVKKYDARPLFVCIVAPTMNFLCLANATFVKRVGYSSKKLETDHITGSINFPDIMKEYQGISNNEENYKTLFEIHAKTESVKEDIQLIKRQYSHDVKLRGNLVEHFIKSSDEKQKKNFAKK